MSFIVADSHRPLVIVTWADRAKKYKHSKPTDSQCNFNAGILDCRSKGSGTQTGMNQQLREAVVGSAPAKVERFVSRVVQAVESQDLSCISISCKLGRHRSVSLANHIIQTYYPRGKAVHRELNNRTFGPFAV
jgi:RNase adaptor protein for sRNA GlmZ degradation